MAPAGGRGSRVFVGADNDHHARLRVKSPVGPLPSYDRLTITVRDRPDSLVRQPTTVTRTTQAYNVRLSVSESESHLTGGHVQVDVCTTAAWHYDSGHGNGPR